MKNNLQTNPFLFKTIVLLTSILLVMIYNQSKAANVACFDDAKAYHFVVVK